MNNTNKLEVAAREEKALHLPPRDLNAKIPYIKLF